MSKPTMQVEELRSFARKMDELMPRRADLVREAADTIMRLRDDLQTQREVATHNTNRNAREYKRLADENDKLREALRAAWKCVHAGISCSDCRLIAGGCTLQTAMQELGIEVDE